MRNGSKRVTEGSIEVRKDKLATICSAKILYRGRTNWQLYAPPTFYIGKHKKKQILLTHMMLALCTAVTVDLLLSRAYLNAYSATLMEACSVISLILCTTPSTICNQSTSRT
ncbi:hypothetical protein DPMN_106365 [Dreissena polymorpha]|uniref:Uncharacterized protein n=1 Tax=Dreissena polymorpha TaxID=45954 RepID=A0A9D4K505_DREPO|nr:hypothetical protein DPMN_106365 [Dreissena polymorpha]